MKQSVNKSDFCAAFNEMDRGDNFTPAALNALYEYLEEYEQDTGAEIELDVIAICCDFSEFGSLYQWADEHFSGDAWMNECGLDIDEDYDEDEHGDNIREYIQDRGQLIEFDGGIIVSEF